MKKIIALDLDGVVFDSENLYRVYTEIYDTDINKKDNVIDNSLRRFQERYNWDHEMRRDFYTKYSIEVLENSNLMPGAELVISKLKDYYDFIIVTLRNDEELKCSLKELDRIGLCNVKIYNNAKDKLSIYKKENVSIIIDDSELVCTESSNNKILSLYFKNNAASKLKENKYLKNVNNWGEIYKYLILNEINNLQ